MASRPAFPGSSPGLHRFRRAALAALLLVPGLAAAAPVYTSGALEFTTTGQSMWAGGDAFQASESVFLGTEWSNRDLTIGGIIGSRTETTVITNPLWWAWKGCKETVNFLCGSEPPRNERDIITDTRTGARLDLTTSGKFGLQFGYTIDSGSVDAAVEYSASAVLPGRNPGAGEFFNLNPSDLLSDGSISTQSPKAEATLDAIAELSGSVTAQACLILAGCTGEGTASLPTLDVNQPILALDPNSLKVVPDLLPAPDPNDPNLPLAEVQLVNQTLTLEGALDATGAPGFKLTTSQFTIADTTPPSPDLSLDLASIEFKLPEITTEGGLSGDSIQSAGRDDFLKPRVDLDGVAAISGLFPPTGFNLNLIDSGGFNVGASFDVLDIDAGPDIGITQDFELEPTLMTRLDFSAPVLVAGETGPQDFWEGQWSLLPDIALLETTTISPTFWIDAMLTNSLGIDLGLAGTMDILKLSFGASAGGVTLIGTNPISLNSLLGLGNELFSTDKLRFPVVDLPFALGGFNMVSAESFTINVPLPGTLLLLVLGTALLIGVRRREGTPRPRLVPR